MSDAGGRAYTQRQAKRVQTQRDELRDVYQRVLVGAALRRELHALAAGEKGARGALEHNAAKVAEAARADSAAGHAAHARLQARQQRAHALVDLADGFGVLDALRLRELDRPDLNALDLARYLDDGDA